MQDCLVFVIAAMATLPTMTQADFIPQWPRRPFKKQTVRANDPGRTQEFYPSTRFDATKAVTNHVYFDVLENGLPAGRITIGVFGYAVPKTALNFVTRACDGGKRYVGSSFRNNHGETLVAGENVKDTHNNLISIFGSMFPNEGLGPIDKRINTGYVMTYGSADEARFSASAWYINLVYPFYNDLDVVFGKVITGMPLIERWAALANQMDTSLVISDSGCIPITGPYLLQRDEERNPQLKK